MAEAGTEQHHPPTHPIRTPTPTLNPPPAGVKYSVKAVRLGPQAFRLHLGSTHVDVVVRKLNDGGLLVQVGGAGAGRHRASS